MGIDRRSINQHGGTRVQGQHSSKEGDWEFLPSKSDRSMNGRPWYSRQEYQNRLSVLEQMLNGGWFNPTAVSKWQ
jgi:hypothetical protein